MPILIRAVRLAANLNIAFTARFYKNVVARDFTAALNDGKEFGRRRVELLLKQFHFAVGTRFNDDVERDRFGLPSSVFVSINVLKADLAQDSVGSLAQFFAKVFPKRTIPIVERRKLDNAIGSRYFFAGKKILKFWGKVDPSGASAFVDYLATCSDRIACDDGAVVFGRIDPPVVNCCFQTIFFVAKNIDSGAEINFVGGINVKRSSNLRSRVVATRFNGRDAIGGAAEDVSAKEVATSVKLKTNATSVYFSSFSLHLRLLIVYAIFCPGASIR